MVNLLPQCIKCGSPVADSLEAEVEQHGNIKAGKYNNGVWICKTKAGDFVFIPKGCLHNYQSGSKGGKVLVISPAGLERYFKEVAHILQIGHLTWELEHKIAHRYGQEFLDGLRHWGQ